MTRLTDAEVMRLALDQVQGEADWPDEKYDPRNGRLEFYSRALVGDDGMTLDLFERGRHGRIAAVKVTVEVIANRS